MTLFVLDTDHLSLYQVGHPQVLQNVAKHAHMLSICVVSVEEQLSGWQRALRQANNDPRRVHIYRRLTEMVQDLAGWRVLPFSLSAMGQHAHFIRSKLNVGSFDLKIAAIALDFQATVVTRNTRDFGRIPGVTIADWSI